MMGGLFLSLFLKRKFIYLLPFFDLLLGQQEMICELFEKKRVTVFFAALSINVYKIFSGAIINLSCYKTKSPILR